LVQVRNTPCIAGNSRKWRRHAHISRRTAPARNGSRSFRSEHIFEDRSAKPSPGLRSDWPLAQAAHPSRSSQQRAFPRGKIAAALPWLLWVDQCSRCLIGASGFSMHHPHLPAHQIQNVNATLGIHRRIHAPERAIRLIAELPGSSVFPQQLWSSDHRVQAVVCRIDLYSRYSLFTRNATPLRKQREPNWIATPAKSLDCPRWLSPRKFEITFQSKYVNTMTSRIINSHEIISAQFNIEIWARDN
jgi:hypothetical protein